MNKHLYSILTTAVLLLGYNGYSQCTAPVPSVLNITNDSVTISWPSVSGSVTYEYAVQLATLPQPASGTPTANISIGIGNLPYAAHKAWVRTDCGSGNFSSWSSIAFTITCSKPATININFITDSGADIAWTPVADITTYEYVLNNFSTDPPGAGNPIPSTSYRAKGLSGNTTYYMHVRTDCGGGTFSQWTTESFTTAFPSGIKKQDNTSYIEVYPNPVTDYLVLKLSASSTGGSVTISDINGRLVYNGTANTEQLRIPTHSFAQGLYILKYEGADGRTQFVKIAKQ